MTWIYGGPEVQAKMARYLNGIEPKLERVLVNTWNAEQAAIKFEEIRDAVIAGHFSFDRLEEWRQGYVKFVTDKLEPEWLAAFKAAGTPLAEAISRISGTKFAYNPQWKWVAEYAKTAGSELITSLTNDQLAAMQALIRHFTVDDPINPLAAARFIRPAIGLSEQQSAWLIGYRERLIEDGFRGAQLEKALTKKAEWYLRSRAKIIARNEMAKAWGHGQSNTMREAISEKRFPGRQVFKEWFTAEDERTCQVCSGMSGEKVPFDESYSIGVSVPSDAHVSCRCDEGYSLE